jgi:hypothetical protein
LTRLLLLIVRANGVGAAPPLEEKDVTWKKAGTFRCYSESNGSPRETRLPVQDWGMEVVQVQYCWKVKAVSGADAQTGVKHYDLPENDPGVTPRTLATHIAVATPSSTLPALMTGATGTSTPAMPFFSPAIVVQTGGAASQQWVEGDLFYGGKPF